MESKENKKNNKIIIIIISSVCLLAILVLSITIPLVKHTNSNKTTSLEYGFEYSSGEPMDSYCCAYKSDTNEFDIDNVKVTFYYGKIMGNDVEFNREHGDNYPEFDVYFAESRWDENGNHCYEPIYLIEHRTENFISEKYSCIDTYVKGKMYIEYNYSEEIVIPKELFNKEKGVIWFCVSGVNISRVNQDYELITTVGINYDLKDGKVILSRWDGKRK